MCSQELLSRRTGFASSLPVITIWNPTCKPRPLLDPLLPPDYFTSPGVQVRPSHTHTSQIQNASSAEMQGMTNPKEVSDSPLNVPRGRRAAKGALCCCTYRGRQVATHTSVQQLMQLPLWTAACRPTAVMCAPIKPTLPRQRGGRWLSCSCPLASVLAPAWRCRRRPLATTANTAQHCLSRLCSRLAHMVRQQRHEDRVRLTTMPSAWLTASECTHLDVKAAPQLGGVAGVHPLHLLQGFRFDERGDALPQPPATRRGHASQSWCGWQHDAPQTKQRSCGSRLGTLIFDAQVLTRKRMVHRTCTARPCAPGSGSPACQTPNA